MKADSAVNKKSLDFALRITKAYKYIVENSQEYVLSKQILRSGTSVGALVREAEFAESRNDFVHKLSIALKEANETEYWLILLKEAGCLSDAAFQSLRTDCQELIKLLVSIIKTAKQKRG